jgi:hypothetical protein
MQSEREQPIRVGVDDAFVALRAALEANARDNAGFADVRAPLHQLCRSARDEGVPPERLVVRLKQTIDAMPEFANARFDEQTEMRGRIVSFVIDAYFSAPARA